MASLEELRAIREEKRKRLEEVFGSVYPVSTPDHISLRTARREFDRLEGEAGEVVIVGRIMGVRTHGGATFADVREDGEHFQMYLSEADLADGLYALFVDAIDTGDVVVASGKLFRTKRNEETLAVTSWSILSKSMRPLPEKWHGITDQEEQYRNRAIDVLTNDESRRRFVVRSGVIAFLRDFYAGEGYMEVETPILQPLYGGALARPFTTHYHALGEDMYMRVAPELYLKRLIVGDFSRVFEIGKCFRNEGIDVTHSPEFTMLESYESYADLDRLMELLEFIFIGVATSVNGNASIPSDDGDVLLSAPFSRMTFMDSIEAHSGISRVIDLSEQELRDAMRDKGIEAGPELGMGKLLDELFKKTVRKQLIKPTFITHHPLDISPLAKASVSVPGSAERVQLVVGGVEAANAYSELNDPTEQAERFREQERFAVRGDAETSHYDTDYVEAMEYGMPPVAGLGIGIDRLVQLLTNTHNIRDVILFPALRKREEQND